MKRGFTLTEIIIVIIIVGILAAVGLSQYSATVEKSRLAEAKIRIGAMRQLAYEYWLNNGTFTGITNADLGADNTCASNSFYHFYNAGSTSTYVVLIAGRCTANGKIPNASRIYYYYLMYYPVTAQDSWHCYYADDISPCFGLTP